MFSLTLLYILLFLLRERLDVYSNRKVFLACSQWDLHCSCLLTSILNYYLNCVFIDSDNDYAVDIIIHLTPAFVSFPLPDAVWTAKYHEWHGSIVPPFCLQERRSGLWILVSSSWKIQQSRNTALKYKTLMFTMKGLTYAPSSQTRSPNPQRCIS